MQYPNGLRGSAPILLLTSRHMIWSVKDVIKAFVGGIIFTLILVIIIPVVTNVYLQPLIEQEVSTLNIAIVSTSMIISVVMIIITLCFGFLFGGGAILRNFGIIGIFGLVFAYWLMGNIYGAILPVATLLIIWMLKQIWNHIRGKTKEKKDKKRKVHKKDRK